LKQIKIYGLGGQGVVTCGKLMAHAYAINQEEFAQTIPAYGHERRGAPVTTSLILSREAILTKSFVYEPDYVLVFDISLPERHVDIFDGATGDTAFLFNAPQVPAYMTGRTNKVCAVDAGQAALRPGLPKEMYFHACLKRKGGLGMEERRLLDGNMAMVKAMRYARVQVVSAYPITPQSPVAEKLSELVADGSLAAEYIRVESEHSALSCAIGAQMTGARACTATSSVGLALMHEVLGIAAGCRIPLVMGVVNRSLAAPWSLWCDHQDAMAERDSGWLQIYAGNVQEVFDCMLWAYRLAEHEDVLLPAMVCQDGFFLSHTAEIAWLPDQKQVDDFLPQYRNRNTFLDINTPMFLNNLTPSAEFCEMRRQQKDAFENAKKIAPELMEKFSHIFGRKLPIYQ